MHPNKRALSFKYALEGIAVAIKDEPNIKIHLAIFLIVIAMGVYFQINKLEWILMTIVSSLVFSAELLNTAIEEIVDSFTPDQHPGAKKAKDVAAGATLVVSLGAFITGLLIFLPKVFQNLP